MEYSPNNRVFRGYELNQKYNEIYQKSIQSREEFWKNISENIFWYKKPTKILNSDKPPFYKWFEDGVTNTCYNALDLHIDEGRGGKLAIIYDSPITGTKKNITYNEVLKSLRIRDKSDKERKYGPLKKTKDSILINTTKLSKKACFEKIKAIMDKKLIN